MSVSWRQYKHFPSIRNVLFGRLYSATKGIGILVAAVISEFTGKSAHHNRAVHEVSHRHLESIIHISEFQGTVQLERNCAVDI